MGNNKDLKKIIGYCSDEILYLPYEEITFELLETACKKKDFFKSRDYITLLGDKRTAQAKLFYKWRILTFAYLAVKTIEYETDADSQVKFNEQEKNNLMKYFINKANNELEILLNNFYSENYSQSIVEVFVFEEEDILFGYNLQTLNLYLKYMYVFFDKILVLKPFLKTLSKVIEELDETFLEDM